MSPDRKRGREGAREREREDEIECVCGGGGRGGRAVTWIWLCGHASPPRAVSTRSTLTSPTPRLEGWCVASTTPRLYVWCVAQNGVLTQHTTLEVSNLDLVVEPRQAPQ